MNEAKLNGVCACVKKEGGEGVEPEESWGVFPWLLWHGKVYTRVIVELWPPEKVGSACLVCEHSESPPCVTCLLECQACLPLQQITMIGSDGPLLLLIAPLYTPLPSQWIRTRQKARSFIYTPTFMIKTTHLRHRWLTWSLLAGSFALGKFLY